MSQKLRIAINTGGGDAPGLNAVIHAVTLAACRRGWEVFGVKTGYAGLLDTNRLLPLTPERVAGIVSLGGTILGTTNRGDPFNVPHTTPDGRVAYRDESDRVVANFRALGIDVLVAVGGDGSLSLAHRFSLMGIPVVAVPKTIASKSVFLNIAEGLPSEADGIRRRHFGLAHGSLCETVAALDLALVVGAAAPEPAARAQALALRVKRMLRALTCGARAG